MKRPRAIRSAKIPSSRLNHLSRSGRVHLDTAPGTAAILARKGPAHGTFSGAASRYARAWLHLAACLAALGALTFGPLPAQAAAVIEAWVQRYDGPGNSWEIATAVAMDRSGNVVVTGYSVGTSSAYDYYTAKYAAADGALLWEQLYGGPANDNDIVTGVAVDASGNVVVTGYSYGPNFTADYYTAKYAAADGALLWEQRYNGPANSHDQAQAVAVDGSGNVVVTGYSKSDSYTAKYAAADGALLWEKRGPIGEASAVAVDGSGNVVVTGYSARTDPYGDYYTAKYAAADGALLWEKHYNGPANGGDEAVALALGPDGMVAVTGLSYVSSSPDYLTVVYRENLSPVAVATVSPLFALSPNETNLFILAPNNTAASVVLDGSQSSDPNNEALTYAWIDGPTPLATGIQAHATLRVGQHTITLLVSDGLDTGTDTLVLQVITGAEAVDQLIQLVENTELDRQNKRPLVARLKATAASFDRKSFTSGLNQLKAFQNKVRAQIAPGDPAAAAAFIAAAQAILDAFGDPEKRFRTRRHAPSLLSRRPSLR